MKAYSSDSMLTAGFYWYRTFATDADMNRQASIDPVGTPLLYLRGEHRLGDIDAYVRGLRNAGIMNVDRGVVRGAGHFTQEEEPGETWQLISRFIGGH